MDITRPVILVIIFYGDIVIVMFIEDLKLGKEYELKALKLFKYKSYVHSEGINKLYDLEIDTIDDEKVFVEVKSDRLAIKTGNVVIEYECNKKSSGINATKADYYVYFVIGSNIVYKIKTKTLKEICKDCRIVMGGDGYRSKMYIVPMKNLDNYKYIL